MKLCIVDRQLFEQVNIEVGSIIPIGKYNTQLSEILQYKTETIDKKNKKKRQ